MHCCRLLQAMCLAAQRSSAVSMVRMWEMIRRGRPVHVWRRALHCCHHILLGVTELS